MDKRFLTAFLVPAKLEIAGYYLKPLCVKHLLALNAIDSPMLKDKVMPSPNDIILFLRICSNNFDDLLDVKPSFYDWCMSVKMRINPKYFASVVTAVSVYVTEFSSVPKLVSHGQSKKGGEGDSKQITSKENMPYLLTLVTLAIAKMNISEREAMEMPIGKLTWYSVAFAMVEGAKTRVISTDEEERVDKDKKDLEEHQKRVLEQFRLAMVNGQMQTRKIKSGGGGT